MDESIRRLEREAAQGDIQAESQLIQLRLRTGDLKKYHVELAAVYNYPAAVLIVGEQPEERIYLYPTERCLRCNRSGWVENTSKMSWRDPDVFLCECALRPFGGTAFWSNNDDEIYMRRGLAAVQFALAALPPRYRGNAVWNVTSNIIDKTRHYVDVWGVDLPEEWAEYSQLSEQNIASLVDTLQENHPQFEAVLGSLRFLLFGFNDISDGTARALHAHPPTNWFEQAIETATFSLELAVAPEDLAVLTSSEQVEDRVVAGHIMDASIALEMIPWLLNPVKHIEL